MPPELWPDQRTPALAIVARGDQIKDRSPDEWVVRSQSTPHLSHVVIREKGEWSCDCQHHRDAGRRCIHILAVLFRIDFSNIETPEPTKSTCPKCASAETVSNGKRYNKAGAVSLLVCKFCGFKFTGKDGLQRRRSDPQKIAAALDLYFSGLSFRKVAQHFHRIQGLDMSAMTVYRWVTHFAKIAAEWMDKQAAQVGTRWHVDETVVNVDGQQRYLWNVLDGDTRFLLATHISRTRSMDETRAPLRKAKTATPVRPVEVRTDGMMAYHDAIGKEFGRVGGPTGWVNPHRRVPSIRAKESNNRIERFHGTEKERTKVMRAFDGERGAASIAEGFRVHYNLVRNHQALGATPAEAAGIGDVVTAARNKWLAVIREASKTGATSPSQ